MADAASTRALIKDFDKDWVPVGKSTEKLKNLRPAAGIERCCVPVGDDIQSGPIYCGRLADWVADAAEPENDGCIASACGLHVGELRRMLIDGGVPTPGGPA